MGMNVHKLTLTTNKVVLVRDPNIGDEEIALGIAADKSGNNQMKASAGMAKELVRLLLLKIDDKMLSEAEKENLDALLSYTEYSQVRSYVQKVMGLDDPLAQVKVEMVSMPSGS